MNHEDEELSRRARDLPRSIEPERDLWPGIEARIRSAAPTPEPVEVGSKDDHERRTRRGPRRSDRRSGPGFGRPAGWPWQRAAGLAVAAGLVGVVAGSLLFEGPSATGPDGTGTTASLPSAEPPASTGPVSSVAEVRELEEAYEPDLRSLRLLVESADLAPETREVLDESLAIIDRAMDEARRALEDDPGTVPALESLRRMYDSKVELLRFVAAQPSMT